LLGLFWRWLTGAAARLSQAARQQAAASVQSEDISPAVPNSIAAGFSSPQTEPQEGIVTIRPKTASATLSHPPLVNLIRLPSWKTALLLARLFEGVILIALTTFLVLWRALPDAATTRHMATTAHIHLQKTTRPAGTTALQFAGSEFEYGFQTQLENISPHFLHAAIASEDWRFYQHGVPYKAAKFLQATLQCGWILGQNILRGQSRQCAGNSTITQQVARNLWIGEARSVDRKIKELLWAIKMETALSKEEILTYYVNRIHLGRRNFGVEMASRAYFGKSPKALTLYEAVILAAAIKSPAWNWATSPQKAIERGNVLLASMKKRHYLPNAIPPIPPTYQPVFGERALRKPYLKHFYQWLEPEIAARLADQPDGQYKVITTLHAEAQLYAEKHLQQAVRRQQKRRVAVSQGALLAMRPNGAVTVMVGGVGDSPSARGMNRAKVTQGLLPRPPASVFKPIIYLAALEQGLTPQSRIDARAIRIPMGPHQPPYEPRNHEDKVYETVTLTEALVDSINTATVRLLYEHLTIDAVKALARRLGIDPSWLKAEWGLALGSSGVPLIEMTTAYSVFANGGYAVQPYGMSAIYDAQGDLVWRHRPARPKRIVEARHVHVLNTMLAEAARHGTGRIATRGFNGNRLIAGKTGTGDAFVDAWFMGYTADLTTGVWLGNDVPQPMPDLYGGTAPARVWNTFMQDVVHLTPLHPELRALP
jgi:penicillin-binding protein 1A